MFIRESRIYARPMDPDELDDDLLTAVSGGGSYAGQVIRCQISSDGTSWKCSKCPASGTGAVPNMQCTTPTGPAQN